MKKFIILFLTSLFLVGCSAEENNINNIDDSLLYDVGSVVGMDAFEIIEVFTEKYGEPSTLSEPEYDFHGIDIFGTANWKNEEKNIWVGFDYWDDGTIDDNVLFITAFTNETKYTVDNVLNMTNLSKSNNEYRLEIKSDGTTSEIINIWVELK